MGRKKLQREKKEETDLQTGSLPRAKHKNSVPLPCKQGWLNAFQENMTQKMKWENICTTLHEQDARLRFLVPIAPMPRGYRIRPEEARKRLLKDPAGKTKEYHR